MAAIVYTKDWAGWIDFDIHIDRLRAGCCSDTLDWIEKTAGSLKQVKGKGLEAGNSREWMVEKKRSFQCVCNIRNGFEYEDDVEPNRKLKVGWLWVSTITKEKRDGQYKKLTGFRKKYV